MSAPLNGGRPPRGRLPESLRALPLVVRSPRYDRWRDADGAHVAVGARVEQVRVDRYGALRRCLGKRGEVLGRGRSLLYVRFDGEVGTVKLRPNVVRVIGGMTVGDPTLEAAMRLMDQLRERGFSFERIAPGEDGPLWGHWENTEWRITIYIGGFGGACNAARTRKSSLVVPGEAVFAGRVSGDAVTVLHTVYEDWGP